jgi:hypothetical protein
VNGCVATRQNRAHSVRQARQDHDHQRVRTNLIVCTDRRSHTSIPGDLRYSKTALLQDPQGWDVLVHRAGRRGVPHRRRRRGAPSQCAAQAAPPQRLDGTRGARHARQHLQGHERCGPEPQVRCFERRPRQLGQLRLPRGLHALLPRRPIRAHVPLVGGRRLCVPCQPSATAAVGSLSA